MVSLVFCVDVFRGLGLLVVSAFKVFLGFFRKNLSISPLYMLFPSATSTLSVDSVEVLRKYNLNLLFIDLPMNGNVVFTRFFNTKDTF